MQNEMTAAQLVKPTHGVVYGGNNAVIRGVVCIGMAVVVSAVMCCRPYKTELCVCRGLIIV